MAKVYDVGIAPIPLKAAGDYSASDQRYRFVSFGTGGSADKFIVATTGSNPKPFGVLQNSPCEGEEGEIAVLGFSKLRVRTTTCVVNIGDALFSDASGYGIIRTVTGCDSCQAIAFDAITSGSAIINVLLTPFGVVGLTGS